MKYKEASAGRAILSVLLLCAAVAAQESTPSKVKVEYEDANVRVSRVKLAAGERFILQNGLGQVEVPLTTHSFWMQCDRGDPHPENYEAGRPRWSDKANCSVRNGAVPSETIVVEFKHADSAAKALTGPPSPRPSGYLDEPHHHWAFENQYVRVYDVHLPPGLTTGYHVHAFDTVFVEISGGTEAAQVQGSQEWTASHEVAGEVAFMGDSKKTRIHRVRNDGQEEYHVVAIQVMNPHGK